MNYGLWMSAAGMSSQVHRQSVIANNLANASTNAFKPDFTFTRERPPAAEEHGGMLSSRSLLEKLGGGVLVEPTWTDYTQGGLKESGNPLDLALNGAGFFLVTDQDGAERLTRNGVFERNGKGMLVTHDGLEVLGRNRRPIRLPDGDNASLSIGADGTLRGGTGDVVARLAIVDAPAAAIAKEGEGLYSFKGSEPPAFASDTTTLKQGWVESSGTDPVIEMARLIDTSRTIEANARLISIHDQIMDMTVNRLGASA